MSMDKHRYEGVAHWEAIKFMCGVTDKEEMKNSGFRVFTEEKKKVTRDPIALGKMWKKLSKEERDQWNLKAKEMATTEIWHYEL
jgi:hypothetical protein